MENERKKWIRDIRDGDQQLAGTQRPEVLGRGVGCIAKPFDGVEHTAARGRGDHVGLTKHARYRRGGDAGPAGHLVDGGHGGFMILEKFLS